ncbi:MAG: hypothetical protein ABIB11_02330, partial [Candidatus Omnitrophota bacterium]
MTVLIFCLLSSTVFAAKDSIDIQTKVDKDQAFIGDRLTYTIIIKTKSDLDVLFPDFGTELVFQVEGESESPVGANADEEQPEPETNKIYVTDNPERIEKAIFSKRLIKEYTLVGYDPGEYYIASQEIRYKQKNDKKWNVAFTEEVKITIKSLLQETKDPLKNIRDIKGPISEHRALKIVLIILLLLVLIGGAVLAYFKFFKKVIEAKQVVIVPAHIIAYKELEALRNKQLLAKGLIKQFYFELSSIVRRYLEKRFSLRAPEMTTEEFLF